MTLFFFLMSVCNLRKISNFQNFANVFLFLSYLKFPSNNFYMNFSVFFLPDLQVQLTIVYLKLRNFYISEPRAPAQKVMPYFKPSTHKNQFQIPRHQNHCRCLPFLHQNELYPDFNTVIEGIWGGGGGGEVDSNFLLLIN